MKTKTSTHWIPVLAFLLLVSAPSASAQTFTFDSQSDGSDGALDFTGTPPDTVVVFDPVAMNPPRDADGDNVFHFTTVTIPEGVTVKLTATKLNWAPVYWLASGAVTIAGTLDLSGEAGHPLNPQSEHGPSIPGPGGYPGGVAADSRNAMGTDGFGPGRGKWSTFGFASSASYGTRGSVPGGSPASTLYGSAYLQPLQGGSGGGGAGKRNFNVFGGGGGAGGGALLIASSDEIQLEGSILARGGQRGVGGMGGLGSGGAVRLLTPRFAGAGAVDVRGIVNNGITDFGGHGRIRVESRDSSEFTGLLHGESRSVTLAPNTPVIPVEGFPSIRIASIAGQAVSSTPTGSFLTPDLALNSAAPVAVVVEAKHIPLGTTVTLTFFSETEAIQEVVTSPLTGTLEASSATADVTFPSGFSRGWVRATW